MVALRDCGVAMFLAAVTFLESRIPVLMVVGADGKFRRLSLCLTAVSVVFPGEAWLLLGLYQLAYMSSLYFAGCQPPKPKEPRRKPAISSAQ